MFNIQLISKRLVLLALVFSLAGCLTNVDDTPDDTTQNPVVTDDENSSDGCTDEIIENEDGTTETITICGAIIIDQ